MATGQPRTTIWYEDIVDPGSGAVDSVNGMIGDVLLTASHVGAVPLTSRGVASGVAELDAAGKLPLSQLPLHQTFNILDWAAFIATNPSISVGDTLLYDGYGYSNITGAYGAVTPDLDDTNWKLDSENATSTIIYVSSTTGNDATGKGNGTIHYPYATIGKAVASITDSSSIKRYTISLAPGSYVLDNSAGPVQLPEFTNLTAAGIRSVVIYPLTPANDMLLGNLFTYINGIVFSGNTGSSYVLRHTISGSTTLLNCVFRDCANGVILEGNFASTLEVRSLAVNNPLATTTANIVNIQDGSAILESVIIRGVSTVTNGFTFEGPNSRGTLHNILSASPNVGALLNFLDGSSVHGNTGNIAYAVNGVVISGDNTTVELDAFSFSECSNDGVRIENIGTGIYLSMFSTTILGCGGQNIRVLNANSTVIGNGYTEINGLYAVPGAKFHTYFLDVSEDDEGLGIFGELHVGSPIRPAESALGEGDSYTHGMLVYQQSDLGAWTDISVLARSASGSPFSFPGATADNAIYVASSLQGLDGSIIHLGIKAKINTASNPYTDHSIVFEYWNGTAWAEITAMETQSSGDYYPHANEYFGETGSVHIRYNPSIAQDWDTSDPMLLGTEYYWSRIRIVEELGSTPIFEQFKLHSNRMEVNADGWQEFFGKARPVGQLPLSLTNGRPFEGNMQNQTVYVNQDLGAGYVNNKFNGVTDKLGVSGFLPFACDTSAPLKLQWAGLASVAHNITWTIRWQNISHGDPYYEIEPGLQPGLNEITLSQDILADSLEIFEVELDISNALARRENGFGDELWISIQPSTMIGTFTLTSSQILYLQWCDGGHM